MRPSNVRHKWIRLLSREWTERPEHTGKNRGRTLILDTQIRAHGRIIYAVVYCHYEQMRESRPALHLLQSHHLCLRLRCLSSCRRAGGPADIPRSPSLLISLSFAHSALYFSPSISYSTLIGYLLSSSWTSCTRTQHPFLASQHLSVSRCSNPRLRTSEPNFLGVFSQEMLWSNHRILINSRLISLLETSWSSLAKSSPINRPGINSLMRWPTVCDNYTNGQ